MNVTEFFRGFFSDTAAASSNQKMTEFTVPHETVGRIAYRLSQGGEKYALLFANEIDSTYSDGSVSRANDIGEPWEILSLRVGLANAWDGEPTVWHTVTFDGKAGRTVTDPAPFCCDPIVLNGQKGQYFIYEITFRGTKYPYHEEMVLNVRTKDANGAWQADKRVPVPLMIGCDRPLTKRVGFIGDSITQGCGTVYESYTHWVAGIEKELDDGIGVWDLGIGFARGYDAATDGCWLARAKRCDLVNVCFGVNDLLRGRTADQVKADLKTVIRLLKQAGCQTVIFTVPPFDMVDEKRAYWYEVNDYIRTELSREADGFFDFARVLGQPAPNEYASVYGGHPNAEGCALLAKAYLSQFGPKITLKEK